MTERVLYQRGGIQLLAVDRAKLAGPGVATRFHVVVDGERFRDYGQQLGEARRNAYTLAAHRRRTARCTG